MPYQSFSNPPEPEPLPEPAGTVMGVLPRGTLPGMFPPPPKLEVIAPEQAKKLEKGEAIVECEGQLCIPRLIGKPTQCYCWSDVWAYGIGVGLILGGSWMLFLSRGIEVATTNP